MLMMCVVCAEVIGRTGFNHPLRGNIDVVEQFMAVVVALGISYCQSHFGNVRMTLLSNRLSGRGKWLSEAFALSIGCFVVAVLTKGSYANFLRAWRNGGDTPELGLPLWIGIFIVTAALGLLFIRMTLQLIEALRLMAQPTTGSAIFAHAFDDPIETNPYE
ncbi:TRAP transporter small permease [Actibacterium sp.]|uniref:TRAP transporter small permease n=1 Tax=Actibacterium sp. TaxID=1872125 RepID=UPI0035626097